MEARCTMQRFRIPEQRTAPYCLPIRDDYYEKFSPAKTKLRKCAPLSSNATMIALGADLILDDLTRLAILA